MSELPDKNVIALGVRQPWAELILSGHKTIEVRSLNTRQRGTIYLYASKKLSDHPAAEDAVQKHRVDLDSLPLGLIIGTVELIDSRPCTRDDAAACCLPAAQLAGKFAWMLANPRRFSKPMTVRFLPYGVWFYPYQRRQPTSADEPRMRSSRR